MATAPDPSRVNPSDELRVVVTGATGNVGTAVVRALSADPRVGAVIGLARRPPSWTVPKTTFHAVDVTTDALMGYVDGADAIVHLAWQFQPSHRPLVTWRANVLGTERVLDAASATGAPAVIVASSVGAYARRFVTRGRVDESWPTHSLPTAAYGREKAYVERMLDTFEIRHPATRLVRMRPAFIFRRGTGTEQRRLFLGPFVPRRLLQTGRLPVLPFPAGMRFQAVHSSDAAEAYRLAVTQPVAGAFNLAAEPVLDGRLLAEVLGTRLVALPRRLVRSTVAAAWHLRLAPPEPTLLDLAMNLPMLDSTRARTELGWAPARSAVDAISELFDGMAAGDGEATAPLAPDRLSRRLGEIAAAVTGRSP